MNLGPLLKRFFCRHLRTVLKVDEAKKRLYTECLDCLCTSPGISTGKAYVHSQRIQTSALNSVLNAGGSHAR